MRSTANPVIGKLAERGLRITGPRRDVLAAIVDAPHGFSADTICERLPGVGRATVYRTIKLLLQVGVLCKVALQDGAPRYSLDPVGHHHHLVCVGCGTISDFRQCNLDDLEPRLEAALGGQLLGHRLEVYSLCSECQEQGFSGPERRPFYHQSSVHSGHQH